MYEERWDYGLPVAVKRCSASESGVKSSDVEGAM